MANSQKSVKLILLSLFILFFFTANLQSNEAACNTDNIDKFIDAETIKLVDITTIKTKKWSKNYLKALTDFTQGDIKEKYKKKFSAKTRVQFNNDLECIFPSKVRISGDRIDHLGWGSGANPNIKPPITSLDVELLAGNINSVIKFKLFIPHTKRGDNEVFSAALLEELGYLAPRTYHVDAIFNGLKTEFLFQEKITKEFIESNNLREAPLLEGDERFLFLNDTIGFDRFGLARILNNKWAEKGNTSLSISTTALRQLNKVYLDYLSGKHISKNQRDRLLSTPNYYIGNSNLERSKAFASIVLAMGAAHALRPHNRSFYYDPIYKEFLPIYYDGNSTITTLSENSTLEKFIRYGDRLSQDEIEGSEYGLKVLKNIDRKSFHKKLKNLGLNFELDEVDIILDRVSANLISIRDSSISDQKVDLGVPYFSNYKDFEDNNLKRLAFSSEKKSNVEICDLSLKSCYQNIFNVRDYSKLLEGRYSDDTDNSYIFVGEKKEYIDGIYDNEIDVRVKKFALHDGAQLVIYGSSDAKIDPIDRSVLINQASLDDRFLIHGGELKDWEIRFIGITDGEITTEQNFNEDLLTGCLTFLDLRVENLTVNIDGALCEDGVNFMRVIGEINSVQVINSLRDAIDVDFSELNFNYINIKNAGNDCVDLSAGNYNIEQADLSDCLDKAVSVGEKSKLSMNSANISDSNMGFASKDSSIIEINDVITSSTPICFSAYNKKQEFWGGKITIKKHNCDHSQVLQEKGSLIEFVL